MDTLTKWLLGATAFAVIGYVALIYGSCAFDSHCHLRSCPNRRYACGVVHDRDDVSPAR